ncbi:hypothetical protein Pst134EA_007077 [Puccinia striiformis f. sp. tritici]|uniref:hypothetical protein n=1 Tax=Puccinia striiformis f. sp. tritici TaxID=168172 RepID=UPI002007AD01|nr:hypothetical protein Pst134EA_007077 [Puccinia striiformis f. sp. tritici]KAH9469803.1 hypothetical protein Pst134EA_007077 [Puccinia striiformis f. sp. tritici]
MASFPSPIDISVHTLGRIKQPRLVAISRYNLPSTSSQELADDVDEISKTDCKHITRNHSHRFVNGIPIMCALRKSSLTQEKRGKISF